MVAVVIDPGLAEHLPAEAAVPFLALPTCTRRRSCRRLDVERVRRRPHADDRPARLDVVDDVLHLFVGQVAEAGEDDHQVGGLQRFQAGDVVRLIGVDGAVLGVDGKQHGAFEAVMPGQDLRQLRQGLLGAVLLVAADQDDVLALAGSVSAIEDDPGICGVATRTGYAHQCHQHEQTGTPLRTALSHVAS